ncbi:hypothetical protein YC2023_032224 [Brassica napus]
MLVDNILLDGDPSFLRHFNTQQDFVRKMHIALDVVNKYKKDLKHLIHLIPQLFFYTTALSLSHIPTQGPNVPCPPPPTSFVFVGQLLIWHRPE